MSNKRTRFFGKYRGTVASTTDPELRARVQAIVPDVLGTQPTTWALPAVPYAGPGVGFVALPPVGAGVWIEFEQGDPDYPIWSGGWWGSSAELPASAVQPGVNQVTLVAPGGARISISNAGIVIDNGHGASITLSGNTVHIAGVMV
jgi:hypothetical protein